MDQLTRTLRQTAVALGLISALFLSAAASPASAQVKFGFGIGPNMYFGDDEGEDYGGACMSEYLLRNFLARQGYSEIFLGGENGHHMDVRASKGGVVYKLVVNWCSGKILSRQRDPRRN